MNYVFILITVLSLYLVFKRKNAVYLTVPFAALFLYMIVQIIMVPMPLWDTIKFIFSLRG